MPYILFFMGAAVFSVCQNLLTANVFSFKYLNRLTGAVFALPPLFMAAVFAANQTPEIACGIPVSGACIVFGLAIPVIIISEGEHTCSPREKLSCLCIAVSAITVCILAQFKFSLVSAAICIGLYIAYLVLTFKTNPAAEGSRAGLISVAFSICGILLGCAITVKNSILLLSSGISCDYITLAITVLCGGCARLYSEKKLSAAVLFDVSQTLLLLGIPACMIGTGGAVIVPKSIAQTDMPFLLMLVLLLALTAVIHKKHTRILGIIMILLWLLFIFY